MKAGVRSNTVAIALAGLAVVIATTGTAVAVTATQVNIVDPTTPSRVAHIDYSGRLETVGVTSPLDTVVTTTLSGSPKDVFVTSPTSAGLAVTGFSVSASSEATGEAEVRLYQVPLTGQTCSASLSVRLVSAVFVQPGQTATDDYPSPLTVKATPAGRGYCLDAYLIPKAMSDDGDYDIQLTGYVLSGRYSGIGTSAASRSKTQTKPLVGAAGRRSGAARAARPNR